uniref:Uncharacterized protein n=1 Tax=Arundo donax TaxID=35708 RepID=A0A0A9ARB9_ARUDO
MSSKYVCQSNVVKQMANVVKQMTYHRI